MYAYNQGGKVQINTFGKEIMHQSNELTAMVMDSSE